MPTRPLPALLAAVLLAACGSGTPPFARGLSVASTTPPSSVLRLPAGGGPASLYHPPKLEPWGWTTDATLPPLKRVIGADLDLGLVYVLGSKANDVVALDLLSRRPRPALASNVREVTMGPDNVVYTVDDSLRVQQFVRRNPARFPARLAARPKDLFGTQGQALLAVTPGAKGSLTRLTTDGEPSSAPVPMGDAAATFWGDLVAIAADSMVLIVDPEDAAKTATIRVSGHARGVVFSPSGHRFYVARREGGVLVYSRFSRAEVDEIDLPGPAGALRADPYGRWLMVRPPAADSLWLVDLATNKYMGGIAAEWASDLPTITNQQVLLAKVGRDVVAYDLTAEGWPERGRVAGGAADFWIPLAWTPETGTASSIVETPTATQPADSGADDGNGAARVYLQVSSSQNKSWAEELSRQLAQQGLPAAVLEPRGPEEGFRVVLGPYPSREAAESTGRKLGRPFFVYQPDR